MYCLAFWTSHLWFAMAAFAMSAFSRFDNGDAGVRRINYTWTRIIFGIPW